MTSNQLQITSKRILDLLNEGQYVDEELTMRLIDIVSRDIHSGKLDLNSLEEFETAIDVYNNYTDFDDTKSKIYYMGACWAILRFIRDYLE